MSALDLVIVVLSAWRAHGWSSARAQWSDVIHVIINQVLPVVRP